MNSTYHVDMRPTYVHFEIQPVGQNGTQTYVREGVHSTNPQAPHRDSIHILKIIANQSTTQLPLFLEIHLQYHPLPLSCLIWCYVRFSSTFSLHQSSLHDSHSTFKQTHLTFVHIHSTLLSHTPRLSHPLLEILAFHPQYAINLPPQRHEWYAEQIWE